MATMRQVMWLGGSTLEMQECPIPEPGPGEVRVRVHACGVCMTEVHYHEGLVPPSMSAPSVWGHEWGGTIDKVGPGVSGLTVGIPVSASEPGRVRRAGDCVGRQRRAAAAGSPARRWNLRRAAGLLSGLGRSRTASRRFTALVTGAGPMGQMVAQLAREFGARVLVSDPEPQRVALAIELGASAAGRSVPRVTRRCGRSTDRRGEGVDVAWETAGHPAATRELPGRRPSWWLSGDGRRQFDDGPHGPAALRVPSSRASAPGRLRLGRRRDVSPGRVLMPRLELTRMIAHRFGLAEIEEAFNLARSRSWQGKILIEPWR